MQRQIRSERGDQRVDPLDGFEPQILVEQVEPYRKYGDAELAVDNSTIPLFGTVCETRGKYRRITEHP